MSVLRVMLKHAGYYVLMSVLLALFAGPYTRNLLLIVCSAALSVSMFATVIGLLLDGEVGLAAQRISAWCLRGSAIATAIAIIACIGLGNILRLFAGG